jgi:hypothetical protein
MFQIFENIVVVWHWLTVDVHVTAALWCNIPGDYLQSIVISWRQDLMGDECEDGIVSTLI